MGEKTKEFPPTPRSFGSLTLDDVSIMWARWRRLYGATRLTMNIGEEQQQTKKSLYTEVIMARLHGCDISAKGATLGEALATMSKVLDALETSPPVRGVSVCGEYPAMVGKGNMPISGEKADGNEPGDR